MQNTTAGNQLKIFLEYMGLTEDEFNQIVGKMTIPPFEPTTVILLMLIRFGILMNGIAKIIVKKHDWDYRLRSWQSGLRSECA